MTTVQQLVVGIFPYRTQAEQAINELVRAGFDHQQIHFAGPRPTSPGGEMLAKIKSLLTGQDLSAGWLYHDLVNAGVPPEETRYYQSEFEAGHSIVAVQGTGGMQMASFILARHGGYGADQSTDYGKAADAQEPTPGYDANQRAAQSTDYSKQADAQGPTPGYDTNQRAAQSTDYSRQADVQEPAKEDVKA